MGGERVLVVDDEPTIRDDRLAFLARRPGQIFTPEPLLGHVWGCTFASDASTVTVHIRRLREKIEDGPTPGASRRLGEWGISLRRSSSAGGPAGRTQR